MSHSGSFQATGRQSRKAAGHAPQGIHSRREIPKAEAFSGALRTILMYSHCLKNVTQLALGVLSDR